MVDASRFAFIDRVCALLIESRFGPYATYDPIVELNDPFELGVQSDDTPDEFFDLTQHWLWRYPPGNGPLTRKPIGNRSSKSGFDILVPEGRLSPTTLPRGSPACPAG